MTIYSTLVPLLAAILFAYPSLVGPGWFHPFILPKTLLGGLALDGVGLAALVALMARPPGRARVPLSSCLLLTYGLIGLVATSVGVDAYHGIWGSAERMDGLIFQLGGGLVFLLVALLPTDRSGLARLLRWIVLGALPTFVYALAQQFGLSWAMPGLDRFASSFGNPAFYGTWLGIVFWLSLYVAAIDPNRSWRAVYGAVAAGIVAFLFLAHSRAPIVGWVVGMFVILTLGVASSSNVEIRRRAAGGLVLAVLLLATVFVFRDSATIRSIPGVSRLVRAGLDDPTTRFRIVTAGVALEGFRDRPILGWGPNNFVYAYQRHFDPANLTNDPRFSDKAHNAFLDLLCEQGIVGLLIFAAFLGYLVLLLVRSRSPGRGLLLSGLIAYLVQSAFVFDMPETRMASMVLFGLIAREDPHGVSWGVGPKGHWRPILAVLWVALVAHGVVLARTLTQSRAAATVLRADALRAGDEEEAWRRASRLVGQASFMNRELLIDLARGTRGLPPNSPVAIAFTAHLARGVRTEFDRRPNDYRLGIELLKLASDASVRDTSYRSLFREELPRVAALSPRRPECYLLAGEFAFREGRLEDGEREYRAAESLNPALPFSYWALGRELLASGRAEAARPQIEEAIARGFDYRSAAGLTSLIRLYYALDDSVMAVHYVGIARATFPSVMDSTIER